MPSHGRALRVQVRVGDYRFDSSRFITQVRGAGVVPLADRGVTAPLDDNYDAIRRQIWLTTDAAYKRAVSVFARKKATFQNRAAGDVASRFFAGAAGRNDAARRRRGAGGIAPGSTAPASFRLSFCPVPI